MSLMALNMQDRIMCFDGRRQLWCQLPAQIVADVICAGTTICGATPPLRCIAPKVRSNSGENRVRNVFIPTIRYYESLGNGAVIPIVP